MLNSPLAIVTFLFVIASFGVGIFSLLKNPKSKVVRLWFLMSLASGLWSGFFLLTLSAIEKGIADKVILYSNILHAGAAFIPILFIHFVLALLYKEKNYKIFLAIGYILALIFSILSFTKYIIAGAAPTSYFPLWPTIGSLYILMVVYFWIYAFASIYFLFKGYKESDGIVKKKILFILIAALIGFLGGGTNWLPQLFDVYPAGMFIAWVYPFFIIYGIFIDEIKIKF
ncbi:MAG: hypothetical protein A2731_03725 [Candidatus Buchananbacteria bacterium RIFCSPHIGHO2_01_FULL_39_8]|uniref:Histidine kinase N-terminal 7TM region domain-containing protein n=1 Tax=Candidatus Buchananbacteria bacterium RIFCSPHIGHO2_01_FULL_39_8 TaxID=1797533 RepID=A0A1G1XVT6_9BACT|nr:MAG: hypothetical protein A2731_03725 [Candidatus Buchananbacteria bacterium RIFCSPHIGHO2_01_FULL_39_8]